MKKNDEMAILIQHFYGNRTVTFINPDEFDAVMLGDLDAKKIEETHDRKKIDQILSA